MGLHPDFPRSPFTVVDPSMRWFPGDDALRASSAEKLLPSLVAQLRLR